MNKLLCILLFIISFSSFAADPTETPALTARFKELPDRDFRLNQSHWLTTFNFEAMKYETPYDFAGVRKSFKNESQNLLGMRIGFGGEIYLGGGLMTTTRFEGFYSGKIFNRQQSADPTAPGVIVSDDTITSQFYGADVVQTLSYLFDEMKTKNPMFDQWTYLTVEPFIEFGVGGARAYNRRNYSYNTGSAAGTGQVNEKYRITIEDELVNVRFGGGINFTSRQGFFFTMKVTQNDYNITKRKIRGFTQQDDTTTEAPFESTTKNVKIDPILIYSIGGGYRF